MMLISDHDLSPHARHLLEKLEAGAAKYPNRLMGAFVAAIRIAGECPTNRDVMRLINEEMDTGYPLDRLSNWLANQSPVPRDVQDYARRCIIEVLLDEEEAGRLVGVLGL